MTRYLLDTNALSDLARHPHGRIQQRAAGLPEGAVCTSILVASEIRFGLGLRPETRLRERLSNLLTLMPVLPFRSPADDVYGAIRAQLHRQGQLIGPNDLFIAAHAIAEGCTLVTANLREFQRIPSLSVENWLD